MWCAPVGNPLLHCFIVTMAGWLRCHQDTPLAYLRQEIARGVEWRARGTCSEAQVMVGPCGALVVAPSTWLATTRNHSRMNRVASTGVIIDRV